MFFYNQYAHLRLLREELKRLLPVDSFVYRLWRTIGAEIHYHLVDWPDESEIEFSSLFPIEALYLWVCDGDGLDPLWFANNDGRYIDDNGELIPGYITPSYSGVEQLAAYGLWLISDLPAICLDDDCFDERGHNQDGQTRDFLIEIHASPILFAYQALTYARKLADGMPLSIDEEAKASELLNYSAFAKHAVSQRFDQQLKPSWLEHCKTAQQSLATISRLDDLLGVKGYDPKITKISPRTLKSWANEVGIEFKPGRPKK